MGSADGPNPIGQFPLPLSSEGVTSRHCARCGGDFDPYSRAAAYQKYCSHACRQRAWLREKASGDKRTRAEKVLERLRQGPATGLELLKAGGGTCYRDQVRALRRAGKNIVGSRPWTRPDGFPGGQIPQTEDGHDLYELRGE
jgi:hypothetical protein